MTKIYLAYDSDMNLEQIKCRCPSIQLIGTSKIEHYKLEFRGQKNHAYANITPANDSIVPVVVWKMTSQDEKNLDIYKGFPDTCSKRIFRLKFNGQTFSAFTYVMNKNHEINIPTDTYFNTVLEGYASNNLYAKPLFKALTDAEQYAKTRPNKPFKPF